MKLPLLVYFDKNKIWWSSEQWSLRYASFCKYGDGVKGSYRSGGVLWIIFTNFGEIDFKEGLHLHFSGISKLLHRLKFLYTLSINSEFFLIFSYFAQNVLHKILATPLMVIEAKILWNFKWFGDSYTIRNPFSSPLKHSFFPFAKYPTSEENRLQLKEKSYFVIQTTESLSKLRINTDFNIK